MTELLAKHVSATATARQQYERTLDEVLQLLNAMQDEDQAMIVENAQIIESLSNSVPKFRS